uniref:RWP-RK domain-containing protein n=1 Tax=Fagus sylvatica TaxID=28930 RepID=A0A2N9IVW1_FAGSY
MDSPQLNIPMKIENPHEFDWLYHEQHSQQILELPPLDSLFELSDPLPLPYHTKQLPLIEFQDFEDFHSGFFSGYELDHVVPINTITDFAHFDTLGSDLSETSVIIQSEYARSSNSEEEKRTSGRKKTALLELDEIQKHFDVPITKAAKEMNVGLTVLKKRCRELKIMRWPHRKIKSLKSLIKNVKDLGLTDEVKMLEEHKRLLERLPDMELTERTKRLRQACFKANYMKRRSLAIQA